MIETLYTEAQIQQRVAELAGEINRTLPPGELDVVCVLKGAFLFAADLVRRIDRDCRIDFIKASSYGAGRSSSGEIRLDSDITINIAGRPVLIVEDIVDTGFSLTFLRNHILHKTPKAVWTAALLFKHVAANADELRRVVQFVGFEVKGNPFLVGYGLDDDERYRQLPCIGVAKD